MKAIYVLSVKKLKRCYVGQTNDLRKRIVQHANNLGARKHPIKALQMDFEKYGVEILKVYNCESLQDQERKIYEKVVMLLYLQKGWQLYNSLPKEEWLIESILDDLQYRIEHIEFTHDNGEFMTVAREEEEQYNRIKNQ